MSTKATIAYGNNFHLYREVFDEDFIYLEMEGVRFEASYNRVMIPIPVHIWEVIRRRLEPSAVAKQRRYPPGHTGTDLSWANITEEEIVRYVEQQVDERIEKYQQAEDEPNKRLMALLGSMPYGTADLPRQQQIEQGIAHYQNLREHQLQVKSARLRWTGSLA